MLQQIREKQGWLVKTVLWAVVLAFVVTIFYSWGVQSSSGPTQAEVATVFGKPISVREFQLMQNRLAQTYRQSLRLPTSFPLPDLREMALEQLATRTILQQMAAHNGLEVTPPELYDHIASIPAFQIDGRFDQQHYQNVLRSQVPPILPRQFEAEQQQDLLQAKMYDLVQTGVQLTEVETEQEYRREHERLAIRYVNLVPTLFTSSITVSDEEIQAHYEANKEQYRDAERRQISYVTVSPQRFATHQDVSQDVIAAYYDSHIEEFQSQEQVRARHILLKLAENSSAEEEAAGRARAEELLVALQQGADFAELAQKHSEDTSTASAGGDLGVFGRGQMVPPFEAAAFALEIGQLSPLVRTTYGFHIIRLEDKLPAASKPLSEVQQEITERLRNDKSREEVEIFIENLLSAVEDNRQSLAALATQYDLPLTTTEFLSQEDLIPGLEAVPDLTRRAFTLREQAVDTVQSTDGTHYLFTPVAIQPSSVQELSVVRERVSNDVRTKKSTEAASKTAAEWLTKVQAGTPLDELVAALSPLQVMDTGLFKRQEAIPQLGRLSTLSRTAFGLKAGEAGSAKEGTQHFVFQVIDRQEADMQNYEKDKPAYQKRLIEQKRQQTQQAFQTFLRTQYQKFRASEDIIVNPQYVF